MRYNTREYPETSQLTSAVLFLHIETARADFSYRIRLELRRLPFFAEESVAASLP